MSIIKVHRRRKAVAVITIDRPEKRNALDGDGWRDLGRAFRSVQDDRDLRAVVLTGAGGAFCAGDDIFAFAAARKDATLGQAYWDTIMAAYSAVSQTKVPVVAAVSGPCLGGGCTLALRADFRISDRSAYFGVPPAKLGLVYPADSTELLVRAVGITIAKRLLYSGETIDAARALAIGLVSEIAETDVLEASVEFTSSFTANAPLSIVAAKLACNAAASGRAHEVADLIGELSRRADASDDCREGRQAFAEKRAPRFVGH